MKKLIPLSLMCLLLLGVGSVQAQTAEQPWGFSVSFGTQAYNGDLGNEILEFNDSDYTYGIGLAAYLSPAFDLALEARIMRLDRFNGPNDPVFAKRNTSFKTHNANVNLLLRWKFIQDTRLNPYITAGIGANFLQFENTYLNHADEPDFVFSIPLGAGVNYTLREDLSLNFQVLYSRTFEDGIDSYPYGSATQDIDGIDHDDFLTTTIGLVFNFGGDEPMSMEERLLQQSMENLRAAENTSDEASEILEQAQQLNDETLAALDELREAIDQMPEESEALRAEMVRIVNNIQFAFDEATIIEPAYDELNSLAAVMQEYPGLSVDVAARADERGAESYNEELSMRRAQAVKDYLVNQGVDASRISTVALGETDPLMEGNSPTAYAQNRSVRLTLHYNGGM